VGRDSHSSGPREPHPSCCTAAVPYRREEKPPCPALRVQFIGGVLDSAISPEAVAECTAMVDTGASHTAVPTSILDSIRAPYLDEVTAAGYDGSLVRLDLREASLVVIEPGWPLPARFSGLRVIALPDEGEILLGRDVLNQWVITLDGPAEVISCSGPSEPGSEEQGTAHGP